VPLALPPRARGRCQAEENPARSLVGRTQRDPEGLAYGPTHRSESPASVRGVSRRLVGCSSAAARSWAVSHRGGPAAPTATVPGLQPPAAPVHLPLGAGPGFCLPGSEHRFIPWASDERDYTQKPWALCYEDAQADSRSCVGFILISLCVKDYSTWELVGKMRKKINPMSWRKQNAANEQESVSAWIAAECFGKT